MHDEMTVLCYCTEQRVGPIDSNLHDISSKAYAVVSLHQLPFHFLYSIDGAS